MCISVCRGADECGGATRHSLFLLLSRLQFAVASFQAKSRGSGPGAWHALLTCTFHMRLRMQFSCSCVYCNGFTLWRSNWRADGRHSGRGARSSPRVRPGVGLVDPTSSVGRSFLARHRLAARTQPSSIQLHRGALGARAEVPDAPTRRESIRRRHGAPPSLRMWGRPCMYRADLAFAAPHARGTPQEIEEV